MDRKVLIEERQEFEELLRKYNLLVRILKDKGIIDEDVFKRVSDNKSQAQLDFLAEVSGEGKHY